MGRLQKGIGVGARRQTLQQPAEDRRQDDHQDGTMSPESPLEPGPRKEPPQRGPPVAPPIPRPRAKRDQCAPRPVRAPPPQPPRSTHPDRTSRHHTPSETGLASAIKQSAKPAAVPMPFVLIVSFLIPPLIVQVTVAGWPLELVAVNCWVLPAGTGAALGVIVSGGLGGVEARVTRFRV